MRRIPHSVESLWITVEDTPPPCSQVEGVLWKLGMEVDSRGIFIPRSLTRRQQVTPL
jgi:hypothetical protein